MDRKPYAFSLRLDDTLAEQLKAAAERHERSIAAETRYALKTHLERGEDREPVRWEGTA